MTPPPRLAPGYAQQSVFDHGFANEIDDFRRYLNHAPEGDDHERFARVRRQKPLNLGRDFRRPLLRLRLVVPARSRTQESRAHFNAEYEIPGVPCI